MQQWSSYNNYWQGANYGAYQNNQTAGAQTFDYNHQAVTSGENQVAPPPPGIDSSSTTTTASTVIPNGTTPTTSTMNSSWGYGNVAPGAYVYPPFTQPQQQPPYYAFNQQQQALSNGQRNPGYASMMPGNANQAAYGWSANYANNYPGGQYYPPAYGPQAWGYSVPPPSQNAVRPKTPVPAPLIGPTVTAMKKPVTSDTKDVPIPPTTTSDLAAIQETPAALQAKGTKEQWSDELKDYVQRAFCSIDTKEEKDQMERILKEKLEYIFRNNIKADWTTENIPTVPSKAIAAFQSAAAAPRPNLFNVVRPIQLFGPRGPRTVGPARGGSIRLPVGVLSRGGGGIGGRTIFPTTTPLPHAVVASKKKQTPVSKRTSPSSNPSILAAQRSARARLRGAAASRSRSRSRSSSYSNSSSDSSGNYYSRTRRRRRQQSSSRSPSSSSSRPFRKQAKDAYRRSSPRRSPTPPSYTDRIKLREANSGLSNGRGNAKATPATPGDHQPTRGGGRGRGRGGKRGRGVVHAARLSRRADRFKDHLTDTSLTGSGSIARTTSQILKDTDDRDGLAADLEECQIVGTMQDLEKPYLRLTRAPEPHEVRPLAVLRQSLEHVKQKSLKKGDYRWVCEQFKSIRQDLTVQGVEDGFAVIVYETHADAALDASDFEEFHQCQSQLLRLYKHGHGTNRVSEFTAYRLLYYIFTEDILGINTIMAGLRPSHKEHPAIRYALDVRCAWALHNFRRFFRLVCPSDGDKEIPYRCGQVISWFIQRERKDTLKTIFKVFRPNVSLHYLSSVTKFPSVDECLKFIAEEFSISTDMLKPEEKVDCKVIWSAICQST